jgi:hypothetical protein
MTTPDNWHALQRHHLWQQENLPGIDTPQGMALLIWLLKNEYQARPIRQLYEESASAGPLMREPVRSFVEHNLAVLERNAGESRHRLFRGTGKLKQIVQEYRDRLLLLTSNRF